MLELELTQANLLKKAVAPIMFMAAGAAMNFSPAGITLQASNLVGMLVAVLRLNCSGFDYFRCDEDSRAGIDLSLLYQTLESVGDEESITIHGDDDDEVVGFIFWNDRNVRYSEMTLIEVPDEHVDIDESHYEYDSVIGIPSEEFRRILMQLSFFSKTVYIYVTDNLVKLSAANTEIFLSKEDEECIIGGVAADDPIYLSLSLNHMTSFLNASLMSDAVWILHSNDSPALLNCPVGLLGNIMFYFI